MLGVDIIFPGQNYSTPPRVKFIDACQKGKGAKARAILEDGKVVRVVMDDTNNTPDVIDRNQLVGQIFIQPTRTAEFIVLDFVILPTGAAFPE